MNGFEGSCMGKGISLRTFADRVDGQLSEEVRVTSGVPQGSGISNETISAQVSKRTVSDKNHVVCDCCGKITAERNEMKLELSSFREIPRIPQEETREISPSTRPTENKGNEGYENKAPYTLSTNEEWTSFSSNRRKKQQYTRENLRQLTLETSNQYATLANLNEESEFPGYVPAVKRSKPSNYHCMKRRPVIQNASKTKRMKQKIVIIGDSHARNSAAELQHCLGSTFIVSSFVKPGAGMKTIVDTAKEDIMKLTGADVVVNWGGSNDNGKDDSRDCFHACGS